MFITRRKYEHDIEVAVEKAKDEMWEQFHLRQANEEMHREMQELRRRLKALEPQEEGRCECPCKREVYPNF